MKESKSANILLAASGDIALLDVRGYGAVGIQVFGSMSATLAFEGTVDGKNYVALNAVPQNSSTAVTGATAAGVWFANVAGFTAVRVRCSAYTSGTPTIIILGVPIASSGLGAGVPAVTYIQAQGLSGAWSNTSAAAGVDASTAVTLQAAVASQKHNVTYCKISATAACSVWLQDGDAAQVLSKTPLAANQSIILNLGLNPKQAPTANKTLQIKSSTADVIHYDVFGYTA